VRITARVSVVSAAAAGADVELHVDPFGRLFMWSPCTRSLDARMAVAARLAAAIVGSGTDYRFDPDLELDLSPSCHFPCQDSIASR